VRVILFQRFDLHPDHYNLESSREIIGFCRLWGVGKKLASLKLLTPLHQKDAQTRSSNVFDPLDLSNKYRRPSNYPVLFSDL
jgi:hypothetical protein